MTREQLRNKLKQFKIIVAEAREAGLNDAEIVQVLGLHPRPLGMKTREILRAIQQGKVKPDAVDIAEKVYGDKSRYRSAYHHLNKLAEAGYLYEEK